MSFFGKFRPRIAHVVIFAPLLMAAKCKRCGGEPPDTDTDEETQVDTDIQDVKTRLQVASITPSLGVPQKSFEAYVYGSGFKSGAQVKFGDWDAGRPRVNDENTIGLVVPALPAGSYDVVVINPDGEKSTLRQGLMLRGVSGDACRFLRVQFDTDKAGLTDGAKSSIDSKIPCYTSLNGEIRIEGHADERGTTDYNLALGQRRAASVARYLRNQGIADDRVKPVSYGEERPLNPGHTEVAWAENRRAEIHASE